MVKLTWSCPRMSSKIASFGCDTVTWLLARKTLSRSRISHSLLGQLLCPIGGTSLWHMSSKLGKLSTSFSLALKNSLPLLHSPFENSRSPWLETWSFWCSSDVPTFWTAFRQTTLFIVRLLIVSSPIHSNLRITWLNGQK